MTLRKLLLTTTIAMVPVLGLAQGQGQTPIDWGSRDLTPVPGPAAGVAPGQGGVDPASLLKPLADSWPTYSGDYTGRRYSTLKQIDTTNVKGLSLSWVARISPGSANAGGGAGAGAGGFGGRGGGGAAAPTIVGGEGPGDLNFGGGASVKGAILAVDDVLYVTAPDNTWAIDARDGRLLWQYFWKTKGGTHIGSRGAALWHDFLFFETPDNYLVSLDAKTGKERWHVEIADFNQQYFSTMAPMVIGDQVLVGTGNDLDAPGFLQSFDPVTGKRKWIFYTVPMKPGDPG
ncbi:MAG: PQQ-binding-like beta-propeller repeat protein, partial [Vicinamibacterales bacterium]